MQDKPYTLNDGAGLSLLVDVNGAKGWRYSFVGKPKMILFGVNGEVSLAEARRRREEAHAMLAKGINPSDARKADKIALRFSHENSFEAVAREWHSGKKATWSDGYAKEVLGCLERDIFPMLATAPLSKLSHLNYWPS